MRDITIEETIYVHFTTRAFATGVPTVLAGVPVLSVLESGNATPITAGVSVSVDRASVVGMNEATIVATAANGYEAGKTYALYISTGTVGGVSVVGEVVGNFTVQAGAAFTRLGAPAGASVSADIATKMATYTQPTGFLAATFPSTVASTTNITAGTITTVTTLTNLPTIPANWLTAAGTAADFTTEIQAGLATPTNITAATGIVLSGVTHTGAVIPTVSAVTGLTAATVHSDLDNIQTRLPSALVAGRMDASVGAIASGVDFSAQMVTSIGDQVYKGLITDSYGEPAQGAPGATISLGEKINYLYKAWRNKTAQTATTYSLYNDDAVTVDHKATVADDATTFSRTEIAAGP